MPCEMGTSKRRASTACSPMNRHDEEQHLKRLADADEPIKRKWNPPAEPPVERPEAHLGEPPLKRKRNPVTDHVWSLEEIARLAD
jgi:hypothetical protein